MRFAGRVSLAGTIGIVCSAVIQFYVGLGLYASAFKAIRHCGANMEVLIMMGTTVAFVYSVCAYIAMMVVLELESTRPRLCPAARARVETTERRLTASFRGWCASVRQ